MVLSLNRGELLRLRRARGTTIEVVSGRVWITEDGYRADRFVDAGRCYEVRGEGLVLVGAESGRVDLRASSGGTGAPAPRAATARPG